VGEGSPRCGGFKKSGKDRRAPVPASDQRKAGHNEYVDLIRRYENWMNPGLDFSRENDAQRERIARLFGGTASSFAPH
jgi:hypothetical protein